MNNKENFSDRLRFALYKKGMSQAEAARKSSISQQALNYIIKNRLDKSKLSSQIALGLDINPEWLIYGKGDWENKPSARVFKVKDKYMIDLILMDRDDVSFDVEHFDMYIPGGVNIAFSFEDGDETIIFTDQIKDKSIFKRKEYVYFEGVNIKMDSGILSDFIIVERRISNVIQYKK
ncbi:hypothetical protein ACS86_17855 [Vibrio alginolyticus]|nr:hypothetical protein ACS86_17855 [Vibrio alginolyticus]